jgi:hypothetical protein
LFRWRKKEDQRRQADEADGDSGQTVHDKCPDCHAALARPLPRISQRRKNRLDVRICRRAVRIVV